MNPNTTSWGHLSQVDTRFKRYPRATITAELKTTLKHILRNEPDLRPSYEERWEHLSAYAARTPGINLFSEKEEFVKRYLQLDSERISRNATEVIEELEIEDEYINQLLEDFR